MSAQQIDQDQDETERLTYVVVLNDELQYSIWRADLPVPDGWRTEGTSGTRQECLAHIDVIWTDMRPRSLRERMREAGTT